MPTLDTLLQFIAPHDCLVCEQEGRLVCRDCVDRLVAPEAYLSAVGLEHVVAACHYDGAAQLLLHVLKFGRARAAAREAATVMHQQLPALPPGVAVIPVPTATGRIRQRGYDQSVLIAKGFARLRRVPMQQALKRQSQVRQLGANRQQRQTQLASAFYCNKNLDPDITYVLIDDVVTTGSTFEQAARVLQRAGAKNIWAYAFAHQPLAKD